MAENRAWAALAAVLNRIIARDWDPVLLDGLDLTDTAIARAVLDAVDQANPTST
jgi:hypothetical protein